jgi:hypothetical protein
MKVRRTGAKKGGRPTWYVWAERPEEQVAVRAGLLEEEAPAGQLFRYVLAWGFGSRSAAREAMEGLETKVDMAVEAVEVAKEQAGVARLDSPWAVERVMDVLSEAVPAGGTNGL